MRLRLFAFSGALVVASAMGPNVYSFTVPQAACGKGGKIFVGIYMVNGGNSLAEGNAVTLNVGC